VLTPSADGARRRVLVRVSAAAVSLLGLGALFVWAWLGAR
jgi:hypothetical protein